MRRVRALVLVFLLSLAMTACITDANTTVVHSDSQVTEVSKEDENESEELSCESDLSDVEQESEVLEDEEQGALEEDGTSSGTDVSEEAGDSAKEEHSETSNYSEQVMEERDASEEEPEFSVEAYEAVLFVKKAVNVRSGPSTDFGRIGGLSGGEQIQVTGIADTGWYQIQYNGATAYVAASYLMDEASYQAMLAEEEAARQQAASEAAAQQQQQPQQETQQQQMEVNAGDYKAQVVAIMNQERSAAGIGGISQNASLDAVAQIRAQEIVASFSHTRPNGSSCFTVLDENGIAYMTAGENIAAGYGTPADVMNGWMNSEGHRANILNGSFGQVGIGYYTDPNSVYGTFWVQIFTN